MRDVSSDPQGEMVGEATTDLGVQPYYRFTRQPVKYHRHHNTGTRVSNPACAARQAAPQLRGHTGSADSSRSSSPEPGAQRLSRDIDIHYEGILEPQHVTTDTENKMDAPLSPREVVQYMLGLDSTYAPLSPSTASSATQAAEEVAGGCRANRNINQSNNKQSTGHYHHLCSSPKTIPVEKNVTSPAQKILSGLRLRRSHSGKDEQLFV